MAGTVAVAAMATALHGLEDDFGGGDWDYDGYGAYEDDTYRGSSSSSGGCGDNWNYGGGCGLCAPESGFVVGASGPRRGAAWVPEVGTGEETVGGRMGRGRSCGLAPRRAMDILMLVPLLELENV